MKKIHYPIKIGSAGSVLPAFQQSSLGQANNVYFSSLLVGQPRELENHQFYQHLRKEPPEVKWRLAVCLTCAVHYPLSG